MNVKLMRCGGGGGGHMPKPFPRVNGISRLVNVTLMESLHFRAWFVPAVPGKISVRP